jgi:uncharacterized protein YlxW (UPF0749 family)
MLVFGILLTTQFRVQQLIPKDPGNLRADDLAQELKATQAKLKAAEQARDRLTAQLQGGPAGSGGIVPVAGPTSVDVLAGTVVVQGSGLIITMTEDREMSPKARVHDEDLWRVLNELLASGAEGVAVNGQRLTSISGIRDVGNRVMIYQTMTNSPFEIAAVGDPAVMEAALRLRAGVVDLLSRYGVKVTIRRTDSVRLPAFTPPPFQYAKVLK